MRPPSTRLRSPLLLLFVLISGHPGVGPGPVGGPSLPVGTRTHSPSAHLIEYGNLPVDLVPMADWAIDLFDRAQLELPPLVFEFHSADDQTPCGGRIGSHRQIGATSLINICTTNASFPTQIMILHELAHAWTGHFLAPERKAAFKELRGWTEWRDYDAAPWHENGTEQAAEIIVWGLIDRPLAMIRIEQNSCPELEAGYRTLTGASPLNGLRDRCET